MASSVDTNLTDFKINSVASEEVLKQMEQDGLLEPNQIYMTPDEDVLKIQGWTLVWTNNNTASGFAGQTISLSFSNYKEVIIYCVATNAVATPNLCIVAPIGNTNALHMRITYWDSGQSKVRQTARQVTSISNSGITFGDGFFDGSTSASLNACIPKYIFAR